MRKTRLQEVASPAEFPFRVAVEIDVEIPERGDSVVTHVIAYLDKESCTPGEAWMDERHVIGAKNITLYVTGVVSDVLPRDVYVCCMALWQNSRDVGWCTRVLVPMSSSVTRGRVRVLPVPELGYVARSRRTAYSKVTAQITTRTSREYEARRRRSAYRHFTAESIRRITTNAEDQCPMFGVVPRLTTLLDENPVDTLPDTCWVRLLNNFYAYLALMDRALDVRHDWPRFLLWIPMACYAYESDVVIDDMRSSLVIGNGDCEDMYLAFVQVRNMFHAATIHPESKHATVLYELRRQSQKYYVGHSFLRTKKSRIKEGAQARRDGSYREEDKIYTHHAVAIAIRKDAFRGMIITDHPSPHHARDGVRPRIIERSTGGRAGSAAGPVTMMIDVCDPIQTCPGEQILPWTSEVRWARAVQPLAAEDTRKFYGTFLELYVSMGTDKHSPASGYEMGTPTRRGLVRGCTLGTVIRGGFKLVPHVSFTAREWAVARAASRFRVPAYCRGAMVAENLPPPSDPVPTPSIGEVVAVGHLPFSDLVRRAGVMLRAKSAGYHITVVPQTLGYESPAGNMIVIRRLN